MTGPFTLDDPRAFDARVAGAKAAGLAEARAAGLPVMPGPVVPVQILAPALAAGASALDRSSASARLAVAACRIDPDVLRVVRKACARFPRGAIVRSSSPLEADPRWSGAFATYHEVGLDDLETALLGCAASVFSRDVMGRCEHVDMPVAELSLAALVQPWLPLEGGGTATLDDDGAVSVHGLRGDPAALVAGRRRGRNATVRADGVGGDATIDGLGRDVAMRVASLARRVSAELDRQAIEWGMAAGRLWLLQVRRSVAVTSHRPATTTPSRPPTPLERRMAFLAQRFPGPMGEATVLPLGPALDRVPEAPPIQVTDPAASLREILALAADLHAAAWGTDVASAERRWSAVARELLAGAFGPTAPAALDEVRVPDRAMTRRLVGLMEGLGEALVAAGSLTHPALVWRVAPGDLELVVRRPGHRPPVPQGADRWEPLVAAVVRADGSVFEGVPVSPGVGAGRTHPLVAGSGRPGPRSVLVAARPVPQIAPLLWGCAGLVTTEGSEGAHLFEVARSLGVPAVTGLEMDEGGPAAPGSLVAVDGDRGAIAILERAPLSIPGGMPAQAGA